MTKPEDMEPDDILSELRDLSGESPSERWSKLFGELDKLMEDGNVPADWDEGD